MPAAKGPNRVAFKGPNNRNNRGWVVGMPGWGRGAASSRGERKIRLGKLKERGTRRGEPWFGGRPYRGLCGVFAWGPVPGKPVTGSGRVQHQRATRGSNTRGATHGCKKGATPGSVGYSAVSGVDAASPGRATHGGHGMENPKTNTIFWNCAAVIDAPPVRRPHRGDPARGLWNHSR